MRTRISMRRDTANLVGQVVDKIRRLHVSFAQAIEEVVNGLPARQRASKRRLLNVHVPRFIFGRESVDFRERQLPRADRPDAD